MLAFPPALSGDVLQQPVNEGESPKGCDRFLSTIIMTAIVLGKYSSVCRKTTIEFCVNTTDLTALVIGWSFTDLVQLFFRRNQRTVSQIPLRRVLTNERGLIALTVFSFETEGNFFHTLEQFKKPAGFKASYQMFWDKLQYSVHKKHGLFRLLRYNG